MGKPVGQQHRFASLDETRQLRDELWVLERVHGKKSRRRFRRELVTWGQGQSENADEIEHALFFFGVAVRRFVSRQAHDVAPACLLRGLKQLRNIRAQSIHVLWTGAPL